MKKIILSITMVLSCLPFKVLAEQPIFGKVNVEGACNYFGEDIILNLSKISTFPADKQILTMIDEIVATYGIKQNFDVFAAGIPNASAMIEEKKRYILYNQFFVRNLTQQAGSSWAATAVLAHEIGHHLNGHTLGKKGNLEWELEADRSSGAVLQKMGASLAESVKALQMLGNEQATLTHPAKAERIKAITVGWKESEKRLGKLTVKELQLPPVKKGEAVATLAALEKPENATFVEPEMVAIKGGCFLMGSPESEKGRQNDEKQHKVCVKNFEMGKYEVTQAQWKALMPINPSQSSDDSLPVDHISWDMAQEFIEKLNAKTGKNYRLPTEAEWEYAARAGVTTAYYWGDNIDCAKANYDGCKVKTTKIGSYLANPWGLHDMIGNVEEWTCSEYDKNYKGKEQQCFHNNAKDSSVVIRGGGGLLRFAYRKTNIPSSRDFNLGFRISRTR
jgi:formylglycine-generating enzyme required for sulfatase activity